MHLARRIKRDWCYEGCRVVLTAWSVEEKFFFNPLFTTNLVQQELSAGAKSPEYTHFVSLNMNELCCFGLGGCYVIGIRISCHHEVPLRVHLKWNFQLNFGHSWQYKLVKFSIFFLLHQYENFIALKLGAKDLFQVFTIILSIFLIFIKVARTKWVKFAFHIALKLLHIYTITHPENNEISCHMYACSKTAQKEDFSDA